MAQKTYTVSESGTYKVRALGSNNRYAVSNEVEVTIATVRNAGFTISGDGESLVAIWAITEYANKKASKSITVTGDVDSESYTVDDEYITLTDLTSSVKIVAIVPMTVIRESLKTSTSIKNVTLVSAENGITGTDGQRNTSWAIELGITSASYDIVSDTITAVLTASDPTSGMYDNFTFTKVPDGSFEFKLGEKAGLVGDLQEDGKTIKIQNATSQASGIAINVPKDLSLTSYTASVEEYGLYTIASGNKSSVTIRSIANPVLTYDAATKTLKWETVEGATSYEVYKGDSKVTTLT